jgi:hypothetical protein
MAVKHSLSQCLQEAGLAVHHLRQLWWWQRRWCSSSKMLGDTRPQCRLLWCGLLPDTEGNSPASMATTTTIGHRHGGKRAVVQTSGSMARHLSAGSVHYLTFSLDALLSGFINFLKKITIQHSYKDANKNHKMQ